MSENRVVLGPESSVVYYNLNKQFSTVRKIVITPEIFLGSFENSEVKSHFDTLSKVTDYASASKELLETDILDSKLNDGLHKQIQDSLAKISDNVMDIQLANYNFMNSMSNSKFNVVLRCESFSISKFYVERGAIVSAIRNLVKSYVKFSGNAYRISRLLNFHIEVFESFEIYKTITLKKEGNLLLLVSNFGFDYEEPFSYNDCGEMYYSKGEKFNFFENNQNRAVLKDHANLKESEIHKQKKILSDENLVLINNSTKNINDAIIEIYLTSKGNLKISNLSLLENSLGSANEKGVILNKSSKNYDKISLVGLRDNLDDDLSNPKYLLIRNGNEIKELLENLSILKKIDGIIFNEVFSSLYFDKVCHSLDIDVIYYKDYLSKSLEVKVDINNLEFEEQNVTKNEGSGNNPFSSIIQDSKKGKDEFLERLKNIDLSTPKREGDGERRENGNGDVANLATGIISSANSSMRGSSSGAGASSGSMSSSSFGNVSGGKKSALQMLADSALGALNNPTPKPQEQMPLTEQVRVEEPLEFQGQESNFDSYNNNNNNNSFNQSSNNESNEFGFGADFSNSNLIEKDVTSKDLNPVPSNDFSGFMDNSDNTSSSVESRSSSSTDTKRYENVLATEIITIPGVESGHYFADSSNFMNVSGGEIFFMTNSIDNLNNPHLNYVLPISFYDSSISKHYFMINGAEDFMRLTQDFKGKCFVNLTKVDSDSAKNLLSRCLSTLNKPVYVVVNKSSLNLLTDLINMIEGVFVKDLMSNDELDDVKDKLLVLEKKFLMRNNN